MGQRSAVLRQGTVRFVPVADAEVSLPGGQRLKEPIVLVNRERVDEVCLREP